MAQTYSENALKMKLTLLISFLFCISVSFGQRDKELSELTRLYGKNFEAKDVAKDTCKIFYFGILLYVDQNGKVKKFDMVNSEEGTVREVNRVTSLLNKRWRPLSFKNKTVFVPLKISYAYEGKSCPAQTTYQMTVWPKIKKPIDVIVIPEIEINYGMDIRM